MSIESTVSWIVADANAAQSKARSDAIANAMLAAVREKFPDLPPGYLLVNMADLIGRLSRSQGGKTMETARGLCTIILLRAQGG
jgi:hypothetical protein